MTTFKIIANGLIESDISFDLKDGYLEVEDCTVTISDNGLYYVHLTGIGHRQGVAVKSPFVVLEFLTAYYRLVEDNQNLFSTNFVYRKGDE
ncbi:hypothetical protein B4W72_11830 [Staphylococcus delphini]|uniref:hypothetical protein n=1 Tax=Staphylococcus delphini TaxID=53344 RepID=UPI000BBB73AF|nr:hypothetical protein [Staphylococcus delphini]PCF70790.1 hypothetical protein B4W72_11830 [Staphylococcus delphini]